MNSAKIREQAGRFAPLPGTWFLALLFVGLAGPVAADPPWQDQTTVDGVSYFAMPFPARVERFDMSQETWLAPIPTLERANAIAVSNGYLVTAEHNKIRRYPLAGGAPMLLGERDSLAEVLAHDDIVIVRHGTWYAMTLETLDLTTGNSISTLSLGLATPSGLALPRDQRRLYGITDGLFSGWMVAVSFDANGNFLGQQQGPPNDLYPRPERHYAAPDGSTVLTSGGPLVDGQSLASGLGSGGPLIAAVIEDDFALILRDENLVRLDAQFRELGVWPLDQPHYGVAAHGNRAFVFRDDWPERPQVTARDLITIIPPAPPAPPNPSDRQWLAEEIELGPDGVVHLHEPARSAVHRFSLDERTFEDSLALDTAASQLAIVPESGAVFVATEGGRLAYADRDDPSTRFAAYAPADVRHMATAGQWIHVDLDSGSSFTTHQLFDADGARLAVLGSQYHARAMRWCPQTRRLYHAPAFVSPNNVRWVEYSETGEIIDEGMLFHNLSFSIDGPLRPSTDGMRLATGSGQVMDIQSTLELIRLPGPFIDMAWIGSELYTLRIEDDLSLVERWSEDLELIESGIVFGMAQRLMAADNRMVGVSTQNDRSWVFRISPDLSSPNVSAWLDLNQSEFHPGQEILAEAYFIHEGAGSSVQADIEVSLPEQAFATLSWQCESQAGSFECGQNGELSESVTLLPGDWVRAELTATLAPEWRDPIVLRAEILPISPDFDLTDNTMEQVLILSDELFRDRFQTQP